MQDIGKQYSKDEKTDTTGFLRQARFHQSKFRANTLNLPYDTYCNYLTRADGEQGKNFYNGFEVFEMVKKYRKYNKALYSNMLRSEHIPFNFFTPLNQDKTFSKNILNEFFKNNIQTIDRIEIEYAPKPKENYLGDHTSFDTYIEYTHTDKQKGIIGIEVKYTEKEYKLIANSTEAKKINDKNSKYYSITNNCRLYKSDAIKVLPIDKFRQIWRNHLLGESILIVDKDKFKYFTSLILFPKDNLHFIQTSSDYIDLLNENKNNFLPLTYESFFEACNKHCPNDSFKNWIDYLSKRYIVKDEK